MLLLSGFASDLAIFFGPVLHILRCMSALLAGTQLMADACGVSISLFYILVCILARDMALSFAIAHGCSAALVLELLPQSTGAVTGHAFYVFLSCLCQCFLFDLTVFFLFVETVVCVSQSSNLSCGACCALLQCCVCCGVDSSRVWFR